MKIGIIGAGGISSAVAPTLSKMDEIECYAVAARDLGRAQTFADRFGFTRAYGSYEELVQDPAVELIYVATPHSHHFRHMMMCLDHGKNVICEKAFTVNAKEASQIRDRARSLGLYAAEAMWPRYMPSRAVIDEMIESNVIGKPHIMTANLSYVISGNARIVDPDLAGGALLDVGVYGLNFALMHFGGDIERIDSSVLMTDTGVDGNESITLHYADGRMAVLTHGIYSRSDRKGIIYGDRGYIVVENINNPRCVTAYDSADRVIAHRDFPPQISGYEYEFAEAVRCISEGKTEADSMMLDASVELMTLTDTIRAQWGLRYPFEV